MKNFHKKERRCPRCRRIGLVFMNESGYRAVGCVNCGLGWKEWDDGGWERIMSQDKVTLEVVTDGALVVIQEEEI